MSTPLLVGMLLALVGPLLMNVAIRIAGGASFRPWSRVVLWMLAACAFAVVAGSYPNWQAVVGVQLFGISTVLAATVAAACILATWPLIQLLQRAVGASEITNNSSFRSLASYAFPYRVFLVATAAVTEEVLYRGYGIGVGSMLFNSTAVAVAVSLAFFVAAHFRWGFAHLLWVLIAGGALSALYVISESLIACIIAHAIVDAVGLLLAPALLSRRKQIAPAVRSEV